MTEVSLLIMEFGQRQLLRVPWLGRQKAVAQISNLLYRRFLIGRSLGVFGPGWLVFRLARWKRAIQQIGNLRYGAAGGNLDYRGHGSLILARTGGMAAAIQQFFPQQILILFAMGGGGNN